jgi:hypothetical protein
VRAAGAEGDLRVVARRQPASTCAPCIRAYGDFNAFHAEVQQKARDLADYALGVYSGDEFFDDLETMRSALERLHGCIDELPWVEAVNALKALEVRPKGAEMAEMDPNKILLAVERLGSDLPAQIARRCCRYSANIYIAGAQAIPA